MKAITRLNALPVLMFAATPSLAQDSGADFALEEVVVTARRAEENLQKVPLSITAISESDIQAMGISSVEDIAALTPGFSFRGGLRGFDRPVIRGMSNVLGAANASFFINGVYVNGSITGYNIDNLERIEVIRGPQSALFGRSTFAGAINYVTRKPTDSFEASVKASSGEFNYQDLSAWVSGPIVEGKLRFEINGNYQNKDGQYTNLVSGTKDMGGRRSKSIGASLDWSPTDWFDATLRANYGVDDDELAAMIRLGNLGAGYSAAEVAVKEVAEETGIHCEVVGLIAVLDGLRLGFTRVPLYSLVFHCRAVGGELAPHPLETLDAGWFARDALPSPLAGYEQWGELAFAAIEGHAGPVWFDSPRDPPWLG